MTSLHPVLNYFNFYNSPVPEPPYSSLFAFPTDLIIMSLSKVNALLFQERANTFLSQKKILDTCFQNLNSDKKQRIANIYSYHNSLNIPIFFSSAPIIHLINISLTSFKDASDDEQVNTAEFENQLFDALLISNHQYYTAIDGRYDLATYEALWHIGLMQQDYIRNSSKLLHIAPAKILLFHKFIRDQMEGGPLLIQEFIKRMHLPAFFNYLSLYLDILKSIFNSYNADGEAKYIVTLNEQQMAMIEPFLLKPVDFSQGKYRGHVHLELMTHPFYLLRSQYPAILDIHFFYYILDVALSYNFYRFSSLAGSGRYPKFEDFKGMLGRDYYEQFIIGSLFTNIFSKKNFRLLTNTDNSPLPDFSILQNEKHLFLIEVKSAAIHPNVLEETNIDEFRAFINKNFLQKKTGPGSQYKGVYQLVQQIIMLAETTKLDCLLKNPLKKYGCTLYPVLISTENALEIPGVNGYLNDAFQLAITPYRSRFKYIYPITLIPSDFFILYYARLKEHPGLLKDLIRSYWKRRSIKYQSFEKDCHPMHFLQANISFPQFCNDEFSEQHNSGNINKLTEDLALDQ